MREPKVTVMLLAGGQGSRLKMLTKDLAKPAVAYGGKYRIIDFPLSNCSNSRMYNVGILTQYKPYLLNTHIGIGQPWDLNRRNGGARVLPPFMNEDGGRWYRGTANAIYENISYLDGLETDYVVILSGDHIYKMDYNDIVGQHIEKGADATISVIEVPWEEASRFGVLSVDDDLCITEFQEKPENPKSNLASMGIYVFTYSVLREYLIADEQDKNSSNDFGKNIIPNFKNDGKKLYAYKFSGYWKDVGTVSSYWQANMDLLDNNNELKLHDKKWKIYSSNMHLPPHFITRDAVVENALINEGCLIEGEVKNSVLFNKITVSKDAKVNKSVVLSGAKIASGAVINNAVIMENVHVPANTVIGDSSEEGVYYLVDENQTLKCE